MKASYRTPLRAAILSISFLAVGLNALAQSAGNSTSVAGTVLDPSGAVVPNATVEVRNPVSGFARTATTNDTMIEEWTMSQRESNLIWLKDVLDHLQACHRQLEWTEEGQAIQVLTQTMLRDLDCCRKICAALQQRVLYREVA